MPAADSRFDRLSLVVLAGAYDRVHYALAMAAAALAANRQVTLMFTMGGCRALLAADAEGPGWRRLLPGEDGRPPLEADAAHCRLGLGGFEELLAAVVALGGQVMVCEMGLRAVGLALDELRDDVALTTGGLVTFLTEMTAQSVMTVV